MDGGTLREARYTRNWTQVQAARAMGVTQAYLSMLERGARRVSESFARKALKLFDLPPTELPLGSATTRKLSFKKEDFPAELAALGYPAFAYLKTAVRRKNPAAVLLHALDESDLDARVAEGLPWLALAYFDMDWNWLVQNAKLKDRQNRLGFAVSLASELAQGKRESGKVQNLHHYLQVLEKARLAREDTFCHESMTQAERAWLRDHRSSAASHWNLLTDMDSQHLPYAS